MRAYERESFFKSFAIFFISLALLSALIANLYHKEQLTTYDRELLTRMKLYNFNFADPDFTMDIVAVSGVHEAELLVDEEGVYALFAIAASSTNRLKVIYPAERYREERGVITQRIVIYYVLVLGVLLLFSAAYALYALRPMRNALKLLETFLKDVIHDLNTPVTAILLNVNLLQKKYPDAALKRIALSARTVGSLYRNLETAIRQLPLPRENVDLAALVRERCDFYMELYPGIVFELDVGEAQVQSSRDALERIVDNLLSNACKYNRPEGSVRVSFSDETLHVIDTGVGIRHPERVFERFYKESERGLGLGMNIVKQLCDALGIEITVKSSEGEGTDVALHFPGNI